MAVPKRGSSAKPKTVAKTRTSAKARNPRAAQRRSSQPDTQTAGASAPPIQPTVPSPTWNVAPGEAGIRVRMYRVGFGDFFLLSLAQKTGDPLHIVIDCGVFKGTSQTGDIKSIEAAVADMVLTTGGKLDLIVMTHRHADHIAGFARCSKQFERMKVGGVWMPVWESEYSPVASKYQAELTRTAQRLQSHFASLGARQSTQEQTARKYMENAVGEPAASGGSNAAALDLLKHGFPGVATQYYAAGDKAALPESLVAGGLSARILGPPPLTDLALMKLMDLQKGVGQYLAGLAANGAGDGNGNGEQHESSTTPFGSKWQVDPFIAARPNGKPELAPEALREWVLPKRKVFGEVTLPEARAALRQMQPALQACQPETALTAAKQLNSFLNNQSLVILFEFGGKRLLFVGDAQAGNWEHWLFDTDDPDKQGTGALSPDAKEVLSSIHFYKVGHHGSGNATPKAAVQAMGAHDHALAAMCSTQADVYGTEDPDDASKGTEVPRRPLLDHLATESALVRSDQIPIQVNGTTIPAKVDAQLPANGTGFRFEPGPLWVDCFL